MAGAEATSDDLLTCEKCRAFVTVMAPTTDGGKPRVRCNSCGHTRELIDDKSEKMEKAAQVEKKDDKANANAANAKSDDAAKWTVIGPDGKVMTFGSFDELAGARASLVPTPPAPATAEGAKADAPKIEAPKIEAPKVEAPKVEAPKVEAPKIEATKAEIKPPRADVKPVDKTATAAAAKSDLNKTAIAGSSTLGSSPLTITSFGSAAAELNKTKISGSALLDVTPTPKAPLKLTEDSELNVGELVAMAKKSDEKAPDSIEELDPSSIMDDYSDDEEAPLSLKDAIVDEDDLEDDNEETHETLSLKDLVVVPALTVADSTPPPPTKGSLGTLPPTKKGDAPPTIRVTQQDDVNAEAPTKIEARPGASLSPSPSPSRKPEPSRTPPPPTNKRSETPAPTPAAAKKVDAKDPKRDTGKNRPAATTTKTAPKKETPSVAPKPIASARAQLAAADEKPKRGWIVPAVVVAAAAVVVWRIMSGPSTTTTPTQPTNTVATTQPTPTTPPTPAPTESTAPPAPTDSVTMPTPSDTAPVNTAPVPTNTGPVPTNTAVRPNPTDVVATGAPPTTPPRPPGGESMSDMLDKAGSARRSGDYATARSLYERVLAQSPGNVEANGGLGDVARATGDLNAAKSSYERALATSPSYGPAQLGLADTEWDLGNRAGAQRRYAQIVERLGERAPARAKERGVVNE